MFAMIDVELIAKIVDMWKLYNEWNLLETLEVSRKKEFLPQRIFSSFSGFPKGFASEHN